MSHQAAPREEARLWIAATVYQIVGTSKPVVSFVQRLTGLTPSLVAHVRRERAKMTREFWFAVMNHYDWTSAKSGIRNYRNMDEATPRMQVDHIVAVSKGGYTEWGNVQVLTEAENKAKMTKAIDYRRTSKAN